MVVRWTPSAADDLQNIANYLFEKTPNHAARIVRELYSVPVSRAQFPNSGRLGKKAGTREWVMPSLPYVIVYQVRAGVLHIVRVLHGSQDWP